MDYLSIIRNLKNGLRSLEHPLSLILKFNRTKPSKGPERKIKLMSMPKSTSKNSTKQNKASLKLKDGWERSAAFVLSFNFMK